MWVFNTDGFFSVVEDRQNSEGLLVRCRYKEDVLKIARKLHVQACKTSKADYPYRVRCSKAQWGSYMQDSTLAIDYDNFKNRIGESSNTRMIKYHEVWAVMLDADWDES